MRHLLAALFLSWMCVVGQLAHATGTMSAVESGTANSLLTVAPGATVAIDVLVSNLAAEAGVDANVDSFTYRIVFPNQDFDLLSNDFNSGFDETLVPAGFNGSIPFAGLPLAIDNAADAGSPGATASIADLYRTTATPGGTALVGPNIVLETLSLQAPNSPGSYSIELLPLELADAIGSLHTTTAGPLFLLQVIPEPSTALLLAGGVLGLASAARRRTR